MNYPVYSSSPDDPLSRFIFSKRLIRGSDGQPKPSAFAPMLNNEKNRLETSVFQTVGLDKNSILNIGKKVEKLRGKPLTGYTNVSLKHLNKPELLLDPNNENIPRHGDITGWKEEKEKQLLQTQLLASAASAVERE